MMDARHPIGAAPARMLEFDAVIVGAGFAGLYMLYRCASSGFRRVCSRRARASAARGTWNRYPGARCDVESMEYSYSFSDELQQEWNWTRRYATQPEILRYIDHVADRFDLRPDIQFETRVTAAVFDEAANRWESSTDRGDRVRRQFLHHGDGLPLRGADAGLHGPRALRGQVVPHRAMAARGRRFHRAAGRGDRHRLVGDPVDPGHRAAGGAAQVFQRTPNFSIPARNGRSTASSERSVKAELRRAPRRARGVARVGFVSTTYGDVGAARSPEEERSASTRRAGQRGGPAFIAAFNDICCQAGGQRHRRRVRPRQDPRDRPATRRSRRRCARTTTRSAPSGSASTPTTTRRSTATT